MIRLFRVSIPVSALGLLTSESTLFFSCYALAYYWQLDFADPGNLADLIARVSVIAVAFVAGAYLSDLYDHIRVRSRVDLFSRMLGILGAVAIFEAVVAYTNPDLGMPTSVVIIGTTVALAVLSMWRMLYSRAVTRALGSERVLFVGNGALMTQLSRHFAERPEIGLRAVGYIADSDMEDASVTHIGSMSDIDSVVRTAKPHRVVIAISDRRGCLPVDELLDLRFAGFVIQEAATVYEEVFGRVCIEEIRPSHLILSSHLGPRPWTLRLQAVYSCVLAAIGLIIAAPILLLAAMAITLTSRGAVLYRQVRVGKDGKGFFMYKLRSMYEDAEARTGAVWAAHNDPRVTPVGRFLRKTRIDEIPQLWNVLRGEMAVVGPRPERPEFVRDLSQRILFYPHRHCVRPGITGWAQINHQYGDSFEHTRVKLEYDLYYIKNLSPWLDAYILFQTVKIMMLSRGGR
jgi:sugar transferase (PEP-CTERM system associated)